MSAAADAWESGIALLYFEATTFDGVAENDTTSPLTNIEIGLYTASPGEAGNQTTNEIAYTSYAREPVARTGSGWDTTGGVATLAALLSFTAGTGGSGTATHFALGSANSGTGQLHIFGEVEPDVVCGDGVTPQLTTATAITIA